MCKRDRYMKFLSIALIAMTLSLNLYGDNFKKGTRVHFEKKNQITGMFFILTGGVILSKGVKTFKNRFA